VKNGFKVQVNEVGRAVYLFITSSGLRKDEVLGLTRDDVWGLPEKWCQREQICMTPREVHIEGISLIDVGLSTMHYMSLVLW